MKTKKPELSISRESRRCWRWEIRQGSKILYGGYCATKKDAVNDSGIVWRDALATRPNNKLSDGDEPPQT